MNALLRHGWPHRGKCFELRGGGDGRLWWERTELGSWMVEMGDVEVIARLKWGGFVLLLSPPFPKGPRVRGW
jgi:hypothetical protein